MEGNKKMGMFMAVTMGIGCIIGSGLFGSFPSAIKLCGTGLVIALVIAFIRNLVSFLPNVTAGNVLPAPSANYMHVTRMSNPYIGFTQTINGFNNIVVIALLATVFAVYFQRLVPALPIKVFSIGAIVIFAVISTFGARATGRAQDLMVVVLLAALVLYIVMGFPKMSAEYITLSEIIAPNTTIMGILAASGVMGACMQGGEILMNFTSEIENPRRTIPLAYIISTSIVAVLCVLIAIVTLGTYPYAELTNLAEPAETFMGSVGTTFFIVGGAVFACLTTLNSVLLSCSHIHCVSADERVLPQGIAKKNRCGVPFRALWINAAGAVVLCAFDLPIFTLMTCITPLTFFINLARMIPPFRIPKLYPHTFKRNFFRLSGPLLQILVVAAVIISAVTSYAIFLELDTTTILIVAAYVVIAYGYFIARAAYLKKKEGFDLMKSMSRPYEPWEEAERKFAAEDMAMERANQN